MGIYEVDRMINVEQIDSDGSAKVTLSLSASPDMTQDGIEVAMVFNLEDTISEEVVDSIKLETKKWSEKLLGGIEETNKIALFYGDKSDIQTTQWITSEEQFVEKIEQMKIKNIAYEMEIATKMTELFAHSEQTQFLFLFIDKQTMFHSSVTKILEVANELHMRVYCILLMNEEECMECEQKQQVILSRTNASYKVINANREEIERVFFHFICNMNKKGASNIEIEEVIPADFKILNVQNPDKGAVSMLNASSLQWKIEELGVTKSEKATLEFTIQHTKTSTGIKKISHSTQYRDREGNQVQFPEVALNITRGIVTYPEECPRSVNVSIHGCQDSVIFDVGDVNLESLGRILQLNVNLKNICPNRRIALAVILSEVDQYGREHQRGMKVMTIPAHHASSCRDVLVKCIKFVLPEDLDTGHCSDRGLCNRRNFKVRVLANPIDTDYVCCNLVV